MQSAECNMKKLTSADYRISAWSGGTTTQLAIIPENAVYADRDFLWRVSSATVDLEESDFTPLPDYDRLIATLEGEIVLTHNGGEPLRLRPLEVHAFSGADATHSVGRCRDFNLMLRRGRAVGTMEALRLTEAPTRLSVGTPAEGSGSKDQGSGIRDQGSEDEERSVGTALCRPDEGSVGTSIACPPDGAGSKDQGSRIRVGSAFRVQSSEPVGDGSPVPLSQASESVGTSIACPQAVPGETALLYCVEGSCTVGAVIGRPAVGSESGAPVCAATEASPACHSERSEAESKNPSPLSLHAGETLLLTGPADLTLTGPATLMLCRIKLI